MTEYDPVKNRAEALEIRSKEDLLDQVIADNERIGHIAEALYCTGQIAVIHHTTTIRLLRLLRELNKETDWVERHPKYYERLVSIREVAAQAMEEYNERLTAVEEAI